MATLLATRPTAEEMFRERIRTGAVGDFDVPVDEYVAWRMEQRQLQGDMPAIHRHRDGRWFRTIERRTSEGGIAAISTDITDLKNREAELSAAKELAEQASRAKSDFLATMSHELRTPLNAVIGFSEAIMVETFGPLGNTKYREYVADINQAGQHLLDLINDILDLSKVESGADEVHEQNNDICQVVASVMTLAKEHALRGGVELNVDVPDGVPALRADRRKLTQILVNLLSNAIKFTVPGGRVALNIQHRAESGLEFNIVDTGIGIAPDDISLALAPFQQIDGAFNRKHEGTGLGLPLTKSLIELHGGSLDLQSTVGVGTSITVRFPAERVVHKQRPLDGIVVASV